MSNVAFLYTPSDSWIGGKNYYFNAIKTLSESAENKDIVVYVFTSKYTDVECFSKLEKVRVVRTKLLNEGVRRNVLFRAFNFIFGENVNLLPLLLYYRVDLLSHSYLPKWTGIRSIPWIPDFQHCYLPEFFTKQQIRYRNRLFSKYLKHDFIFLSSKSAQEDAANFYDVKAEILVYKFPPIEATYDLRDLKENTIEGTANFMFLPNQFWQHKNHIRLIEACKLAKKKGIYFKVYCTGHIDTEYARNIINQVKLNSLDEYIEVLGLVARSEFIKLLVNCSVLINPSLFEGWSTTVEEGIACNKVMVLSDIPVHREQTSGLAPGVHFFDPKNAEDLLDKILLALSYNDSPIYSRGSVSKSLMELIEQHVK